ncbi:MAG: hypothetical protein ACLU9X_03370 [Alistipes shahii]
MVYNMATDNAFFFENTNIWNKDGDYLYADRGAYDKADTLYRVTRNGYMLTEKQEMWSDSIDYYRAEDHVILRRDLQLDDAEHKVIAFGDYGEYWKEPGNAFLTRRPAVVSYDLSQGDSLFMRADSMYLFTINENALRRAAGAGRGRFACASENRFRRLRFAGRAASRQGLAATAALTADVSCPVRVPAVSRFARVRRWSRIRSPQRAGSDSRWRMVRRGRIRCTWPFASGRAARSTRWTGAAEYADRCPAQGRQEAARKAKAERRPRQPKPGRNSSSRSPSRRQEKATAKLLAQKEREERRLAARRLKAESKLQARQARAARKSK